MPAGFGSTVPPIHITYPQTPQILKQTRDPGILDIYTVSAVSDETTTEPLLITLPIEPLSLQSSSMCMSSVNSFQFVSTSTV